MLKYLDYAGLQYLIGKIKAQLSQKLDVNAAAQRAIADSQGRNIEETYITRSELNSILGDMNFGFAATEDDM